MSEVTYSRRKNGHVPPKPGDMIAWKHNGLPEPELVIRSPLDPRCWLDQAQRVLLVASLEQKNVPFTSRKSKRPILRPKPGQYGWFRPHNPRKRSRDRFEFTLDRFWITAPPGTTDEY